MGTGALVRWVRLMAIHRGLMGRIWVDGVELGPLSEPPPHVNCRCQLEAFVFAPIKRFQVAPTHAPCVWCGEPTRARNGADAAHVRCVNQQTAMVAMEGN